MDQYRTGANTRSHEREKRLSSSSRVRIYALQLWRRRTRPMQSIEEKTAPRASAPPLTPPPTQLLLLAVELASFTQPMHEFSPRARGLCKKALDVDREL
uniref:Uncharacterized protein n=1 Tax=Trichogramma kaykai TaxID=54128 RepID=A0ABD2WPI7_9HYME